MELQKKTFGSVPTLTRISCVCPDSDTTIHANQNDDDASCTVDKKRRPMHVFVYQEWEVMREQQLRPEERLEKMPTAPTKMNTFSVLLQEARIKKRMTLAELANKCNISNRQMSLYENGTETPPQEVYQRITKELNIE